MIPDPVAHLRTLTDLLGPTTATFANQQWSLSEFQRKSLVTGDHPVSLLADSQRSSYMGVGLATAAGYSLPLSRRHGLVIGASPDLPDLWVRGTAQLAKATNQGTVLNSRKCLYYHPDDDPVVRELHLPNPRPREIAAQTSHLVSEEGFHGQLSENELKDLPVTLPGGAEGGFSLKDLPWPLPRRAVTWKGPNDGG